MNAVMVQGDAVGTTLYYGKGAGAEPTASAVIADLVDMARLATADPDHRVPHLAFQPAAMQDLGVLPIDEVVTAFYLRLQVADEAGVLARITGILAEHGISIDALLQRPGAAATARRSTDVIILTHDTVEGRMTTAIAKMQALPTVLARIVRIRKEDLALKYVSTRGEARRARLRRDPARRPRARRRALPSRALSAGRRGDARALARAAVPRARVRADVALRRRHRAGRPARAGRRRPTPRRCSATPRIAPLRPLEPGVFVLGLSNGPTLAFKDMAMQFLGNAFEHELARRGRTLNVLGATSGDTGSAAEHALRGKRGIRSSCCRRKAA